MKMRELRERKITELQEDLLELLRAQFKLRMQQGNGQLNRHHQLKSTRRDIARIKTVLNEKVK